MKFNVRKIPHRTCTQTRAAKVTGSAQWGDFLSVVISTSAVLVLDVRLAKAHVTTLNVRLAGSTRVAGNIRNRDPFVWTVVTARHS
jgi:hypothetical protein